MFYSKKLLKQKEIRHCFFNRKGGKSKGIYRSLNCGKGSLDKKISVVSFSTFVKEQNFETIDFVKMNIEGSEYELLEEIIESGNILKITHLQIQFHNFVENATEQSGWLGAMG